MKRKDLVQNICQAATEKKAADIVVIDITQMSVIADDFIICSGNSKAQVKAICDNIEEKLQKNGANASKIDGYEEARWIVMDYGDVLVHIFKDEDRIFYNLERLWNNGVNAYVYKGE